MMTPPTYSAAANCQPISTTSTTPSSTTRFVDANMKIIEVTKSAPLANSDFAIAEAAYEQDEESAPNTEARVTAAGPLIAEPRAERVPRHERLHDAGQSEAEDQRPERVPEHEERLAQRGTDAMQHGVRRGREGLLRRVHRLGVLPRYPPIGRRRSPAYP